MDKTYEAEYWVPEHVREYLRSLGFVLPLESMEGYIRAWHEWMSATGDFYDYRDTDGFGRIYEVHRRSIHPAMSRFRGDAENPSALALRDTRGGVPSAKAA